MKYNTSERHNFVCTFYEIVRRDFDNCEMTHFVLPFLFEKSGCARRGRRRKEEFGGDEEGWSSTTRGESTRLPHLCRYAVLIRFISSSPHRQSRYYSASLSSLIPFILLEQRDAEGSQRSVANARYRQNPRKRNVSPNS